MAGMQRTQRQAAPSDDQIIAANLMARQSLLAASPRMIKNLGAFTSPGNTTRIKLFNVGITTRLMLQISATVTIGTATAVPSGKAPYNLISRVRVTDYDGTDRVNLSGFQLFIWNSVRLRGFYGANTQGQTAILINPSVPTAVGAGTITFFTEVPFAFDVVNPIVTMQDLRGAMMMQTAVGEAYLNIDWNQSLYTNNDVESVYAGAATTTVVAAGAAYITCNVWQHYIMPQPVNGRVPIPAMDLNTVYEFAGNIKSSDNLAANSERLFPYPNMRSVIGSYFNFVAGGVLASTITGVRIVVNGSTIQLDESYALRLFMQRLYLDDTDLFAGSIFIPHREKPIETWLFGNVQFGLTPSAVGANPYVESGYESFYTKGAALPGIPQGSG